MELNIIILIREDEKRIKIPAQYPYKIVAINTGASEKSKVKNGSAGTKGIFIRATISATTVKTILTDIKTYLLCAIFFTPTYFLTHLNHTK